MTGDPKFPLPEKSGRDVTAEFMQGGIEFMESYDSESLRQEPRLEIHMDLTGIADRNEFVSLARRAKAFLETIQSGQEREASIRCTKDQQKWEHNVFNSGVRWEKAD